MTELQWLIKMLTQHKLPGPVKDLFIERIGEVEASYSKAPKPIYQEPRVYGSTMQAPSTQKILDAQQVLVETGSNTQQRARIIVPQEVTTSVGNGTSTRGPRKF